MMIFAYPGTILVKPLEEKTPITYTTEKKGRLFKGEVIHVGDAEMTTYGKLLETPVKKGMTVWFLSYEGDYDNTTIENQKYYFVLFKDIRGYAL